MIPAEIDENKGREDVVYKLAYELCLEIEKLPESEEMKSIRGLATRLLFGVDWMRKQVKAYRKVNEYLLPRIRKEGDR